MTDFASLQIKIDSADVKSGVEALNKLTDAGAKAEQSEKKRAAASDEAASASKKEAQALEEAAQRYMRKASVVLAARANEEQAEKRAKAASEATAKAEAEAAKAAERHAAEADKLRSMLDPLYAAQKRVNEQLALAEKVFRNGSISAEEYAKVQTRIRSQLDATTHSAGSSKAGMQQLAYQLSDVSTMFAMGAKPMQIFASQGGQVVQALQLMSGESKGLLGFLGGPWGMVLTAAVAALTPLIAKLFDTADAANTASAALKSWGTQAGLSDRIAEVGELNKQYALAQGELARVQRMVDKMPGGSASVLKQNTELAKTYRAALQNVTSLSGEIKNSTSLIDLWQKRIDDANAKTEKASTKVDRHSKSLRGVSDASREAAKATEELADMLARVNSSILATPRIDPMKGGERELERVAREAEERVRNRMDSEKAIIAEAQKRTIDTANAVADIIGGKVGNVLRTLASVMEGFQTGNFSGVGGALGGVLQLISGPGGNGFKMITSKLDEIFGGAGSRAGSFFSSLSSSLSSFMPAYGLSQMIAQPIGQLLGFNSTDTAIGGLLGGFVGKMIRKPKKGISTLGFGEDGLEITSTTGNSGSRKKASIQLGNSIIDTLASLADQLGGDLGGSISTSIGVRKKKFVVDPTGQGRTKGAGVLKFSDEAEAVKAALADAIRDGAITGLRAGTQALLQKAGDIEAQAAKALKFEAFFRDLKAMTDPLGAAMDGINTQFESLTKLFQEAGASAEEYAKLEQWKQLKIAEVQKQANAEVEQLLKDRQQWEIRLLTAQGKTLEATALARQMELDAADASLRPLMRQVYAAEDAADALEKMTEQAQKFADYADNLMAYRDSLRGASGGSAGAYRIAQVNFMKMAALAAAGDEKGLSGLQSAGDAFIAASKSRSATMEQYRRDQASVMKAVDSAINAATSQSVQTQAIAQLSTSAATMAGATQNIQTVISDLSTTQTDLAAKLDQLRTEMTAALLPVATNLSSLNRMATGWDRGDSLSITSADTLTVHNV